MNGGSPKSIALGGPGRWRWNRRSRKMERRSRRRAADKAAGTSDPGYNYFLCDFLGPECARLFAFTDDCTFGRFTARSCGGGVAASSRAWAAAAFACAREIWSDVGMLLSTGRSLFCPFAWECKVAA